MSRFGNKLQNGTLLSMNRKKIGSLCCYMYIKWNNCNMVYHRKEKTPVVICWFGNMGFDFNQAKQRLYDLSTCMKGKLKLIEGTKISVLILFTSS